MTAITRNSFKYNFLKQIIMRLDFQGVLEPELDKVLLDIKPYLKSIEFDRYEEKSNNEIDFNIVNGMPPKDNPIKEIRNMRVFSFTNENSGYTFDVSKKFICLKINNENYTQFETYSKIFLNLVKAYKDKLDYFAMNRFGIRKINFCFFKDIDIVQQYFKKEYYNYSNFIPDTTILSSERRESVAVGQSKLNLRYAIEQGTLETKDVYKVVLDSDIYLDNSDVIEKNIFNEERVNELNEKLFESYKEALTQDFIDILAGNKAIPSEIIGVGNNE